MSKMIGIRVPDDSDLPERFKALSEKTRFPYHELLEQFLYVLETGEVDVKSIFKRRLNIDVKQQLNLSDDKVMGDISFLLSRVDVLERVVEKLGGLLSSDSNRDLNFDVKQDVKSDVKPNIASDVAVESSATSSVKPNVKRNVKLIVDDKSSVEPDVKSNVKYNVKPVTKIVKRNSDVKQESVDFSVNASLDKSAVMARIFDLKFKGLSLSQIADRLESEGIPTFSGKSKWYSGTISKLIKKSC